MTDVSVMYITAEIFVAPTNSGLLVPCKNNLRTAPDTYITQQEFSIAKTEVSDSSKHLRKLYHPHLKLPLNPGVFQSIRFFFPPWFGRLELRSRPGRKCLCASLPDGHHLAHQITFSSGSKLATNLNLTQSLLYSAGIRLYCWTFCPRNFHFARGNLRFEVFTVVLLRFQVFWDVTPCRCASGSRRFERWFRLQLQGSGSPASWSAWTLPEKVLLFFEISATTYTKAQGNISEEFNHRVSKCAYSVHILCMTACKTYEYMEDNIKMVFIKESMTMSHGVTWFRNRLFCKD